MGQGTVTRDGRGGRIVVVLAALLATSGCVATATQPDAYSAGGGARLVALEQEHDFGAVANGPVVTHVFRLKNLGPEAIHIASVTGACGCTAILASSSSLAAGEEGAVEVALDTYRLTGEQAKSVVVHSDDPIRPQLTLTLHGSVSTQVSARPSRVYLGRLPVGAVVSQHVDVQLAPDVQVTQVSSESVRFTLETTPLEAPSHGVRVRVTLLPTAQAGAFDDRIVIATTSERQPQITIPVLGTLERGSLYAGAAHDAASR